MEANDAILNPHRRAKFPWSVSMIAMVRAALGVTCGTVFSALLTTGLALQDKPDFSGEWTLVTSLEAPPDAALSLSVRQTSVSRDVRGATIPAFFKELKVERRFGAEVRTDTYQIGVEGGAVSGMGSPSETRFFVKWDDNKLVMWHASYPGGSRTNGPSTESTEVWQLDASGRLVVSMTRRGAGTATTTQTVHYRKT